MPPPPPPRVHAVSSGSILQRPSLHPAHQRAFLLRDADAESGDLLFPVLHLQGVVFEDCGQRFENVRHSHVAADAHAMADAKGGQMALELLGVRSQEAGGVEDIVIRAPYGGIVVHHVVQAKDRGLCVWEMVVSSVNKSFRVKI